MPTGSAPKEARGTARVLIVDDNGQNRELASRLLAGAGFQTITADGGYQCLYVLSSQTVDAVLLDLMMPDLDGIQVCREIRGELKLDLLPVIMLTGSNSDAHIEEAFAAGATDYCTKPMKKVEVVARLDAAIAQCRATINLRELQRTLEHRVHERTEQLNAAAQELGRKNTFLSSILDTALSGVITIDERGIIETFNRAAETIFGYRADEVIGRNVSVLMPSPDRECHDVYLRNYLATGQPKIIGTGREVDGRRKDRSTVRIELAVSEMQVDGRRLFTGIVTDVSVRHAMQQAFGEAQQRLLLQNDALSQFGQIIAPGKASFNAALDQLAQLCREATDARAVEIVLRDENASTAFRIASRAPAAHGLGAADAAAEAIIEAKLLSDPIATYARAPQEQDAATSEGAETVLAAAITVDGKLHGVVRCNRGGHRPWHLDEQNFVAFLASQVALLVQAHLRAQVQQRLAASEARLRNAQRLARLGDFEWDPASGEFIASTALRAVVAPYQRTSLASFEDFIARVHPDDRATLCGAIDACMANAMPFSLDFRVLSNNEELYLQGRGELRTVPGMGPRLSCAVVDVTARKRAEIALKEMRNHLQEQVNEQTRDLIVARDAALAGERAMSTFLANMSHEIRTPLHAVLSYARFGLNASDPLDTDTVKQHFGVIRDSGEELLDLLNDLLDLSKLRAGRMAYEFNTLSLVKLCQEVLGKFAPLLDEHGQTVLIAHKGSDRPVHADERKLKQVLRNLLSNAIKFSPKHGIIQITVDCSGPDCVQIAVKDRGAGIPANELESIFNPFAQSSQTAAKGGGTGLGLAICKEIVEAGHRGRIWASNNPDGGATFTFTLPFEAR